MSLENSLANLRGLKDGWDGRGSAAPSEQALITASGLNATAVGTGGVILGLYAGDAEVEIEIDVTGEVIAVTWAKKC